MSPYIEVSNDKWKGKTHPVKDGHLNPKFMENLSIPFNSVFDRVIIEIKDGESKIGYEALYIF
jgi:Ca2+-dependent lipid-binding protein